MYNTLHIIYYYLFLKYDKTHLNNYIHRLYLKNYTKCRVTRLLFTVIPPSKNLELGNAFLPSMAVLSVIDKKISSYCVLHTLQYLLYITYRFKQTIDSVKSYTQLSLFSGCNEYYNKNDLKSEMLVLVFLKCYWCQYKLAKIV